MQIDDYLKGKFFYYSSFTNKFTTHMDEFHDVEFVDIMPFKLNDNFLSLSYCDEVARCRKLARTLYIIDNDKDEKFSDFLKRLGIL